ncbi:hypothetical protein BJX96DRAFT_180588 [Aspergillus floccosus]
MSLTHDDYAIAWICALPLEVAAARIMLDKTHSPLPQPSSDPNAYKLGELNGHHIVIACLPAGVYGTVSATAVVSRMRSTFPRLQYALMVGIGGGVPNKANDIRLGDVVVSKPTGTYSGVVQYDYGKAIQGGIFQPTGTLNKPPKTLLMHMSQLEAQQMTEGGDTIFKIVLDALRQYPHMAERFSPPKPQMDLLFLSGYHHAKRDEGCDQCDKDRLVHRQVRNTRSPYIHYGLIASGDQVMKDSETRDCLAQQHGILCFEMEAAGLMDELPTLVIRGICDYCDSHKQKEWQGYAALTAAAYAKWLLSVVPGCHTDPQVTRKVRHWMVPFARNTKFVGRQKELAELERTISVQDGPSRVAITGLGGVGKTQIALEVAYRVRERDNECSIFWVPCTSHAMIEQTFLTIAQVLGLSGVKYADAKEQIKAYLSSERGGRWLLIFDNADDAELWLAGDRTDPALEDFIPQSEQGRIIFTSRNLELAVDLAFSNIIAIPDIDPDTAAQILEKSLARKELLNDRTAMAALLKQLAYFPLAIVQASAYINKKRLGLSSYSALLKETEEEAVELLSEDFRDPGRYRDIQNPVMTTWLISFNQIQQQDQLAADYLSFIACIDPRKIPRSLLPSHAAKQQADALGMLNAYSFINSQDADISIHRLVHLASRNWLKSNGLFSYWLRRVADQIQQVFPNDHHTNRQLWRKYLPHALALIRENGFKELQKDCIYLIWDIANCLARDGRFHEAEVLYSQLTQMNQVENGAEHPDTLTSMADLSSIHRRLGRWAEAEKLGMKVLETRKRVLGPKHPQTLTSMANLAAIYHHQERLNEAEKLTIQVLETEKTVLGPKHPQTLAIMGNLALIYQDQRRLNEAEKLALHVLEKRKTVLGAGHPDTLVSMAHLALVYTYQRRWNEAATLNTQVIDTRKSMLGTEHPDTLTSMANLAATYQNLGQWNEAEKLGLQVWEKRKTVLGPEHPHTLVSMAYLALIDMHHGRWGEAEKLNTQILETAKSVLGAEHPDTLTYMANLAHTWKSMGKLQDSLTLMEKCSLLRTKVLGSDHPDTKSSARVVADWKDEHNASHTNAPLYPSCILKPQSSSQVADAISILSTVDDGSYRCKFAVRSGGHTPWAGAAISQGGVVVDLSRINSTVFNPQSTTASIGAGAKWASVYRALKKHGVAVTRGRADSVGVGGLVTGGGLSFFTAQHGFVCDNVQSFEVVLADGTLVIANSTSHSSLFRELKGGSNNVGIVTKIELATFPQGDLWGGIIGHQASTIPLQIGALVNFTERIVDDPFASLVTIWQYTSESEQLEAATGIQYARPVQRPAIFDEFLRIAHSSTTRVADIYDLMMETAPPPGQRVLLLTLTFANDARVVQKIFEEQKRMIDAAKPRISGEVWNVFSFLQPFPALFGQLSTKNMGNILGRGDMDKNCLLYLLFVSWDNRRDDHFFHDLGYRLIDSVRDYSREMGAGDEFIYLNYAGKAQNPLRSYGEDNLREILRVTKEYDPDRVFQIRVPGGFKASMA